MAPLKKKPASTCKYLKCMNEVLPRHIFCSFHCCRIPLCRKTREKCDDHYCKSGGWCLEPVSSKTTFCSKHACVKCGNHVERATCAEHYCALKRCSKRKKDGSDYCEEHTCPICSSVYPCEEHTCGNIMCARTISGHGERYCDHHDFHGLLPKISSGEERELFYKARDILSTTCFCHDKKHNSYCALHYYHYEYDKDTSPSNFIQYGLRVGLVKRLMRIGDKKNKSITRDVSQQYGLICNSYCSYGYCYCDVMPKICLSSAVRTLGNLDTQGIPFVEARADVRGDEEVYMISNVGDCEDYIQMAWTIPKSLWDDCQQVPDDDNELESMIRFDYVRRPNGDIDQPFY